MLVSFHKQSHNSKSSAFLRFAFHASELVRFYGPAPYTGRKMYVGGDVKAVTYFSAKPTFEGERALIIEQSAASHYRVKVPISQLVNSPKQKFDMQELDLDQVPSHFDLDKRILRVGPGSKQPTSSQAALSSVEPTHNLVVKNKLAVEPTVQKPIVQEPVNTKPTLTEPTVQEPTVLESTTPKPSMSEPTASELALQSPLLEQPANPLSCVAALKLLLANNPNVKLCTPSGYKAGSFDLVIE